MEGLCRLGLGSYRSFDQSPTGPGADELVRVLQAFHAAGGRAVDSSPMYGRAEATFGAVSTRAGLNAELWIATKVWTDGQGAGRTQMEESFQKLGRKGGRLELMQVHNLRDFEAQWPTLRCLKAEGRLSAIGISHYTPSAFDELERVMRRHPVDWLQIPYSLAQLAGEQRLLGVAADLGVKVIANEPFDKGSLITGRRGQAVPAWAQAELGVKTWAAYCLKFILGDPRIDLAIPATSKLAHLEEMLPALKGPLPNEAQRERMRRER